MSINYFNFLLCSLNLLILYYTGYIFPLKIILSIIYYYCNYFNLYYVNYLFDSLLYKLMYLMDYYTNSFLAQNSNNSHNFHNTRWVKAAPQTCSKWCKVSDTGWTPLPIHYMSRDHAIAHELTNHILHHLQHSACGAGDATTGCVGGVRDPGE
jgi:hypothetical protein